MGSKRTPPDRARLISVARGSGLTSTPELSEVLGIPGRTLRRYIQQADAGDELREIYRENAGTQDKLHEIMDGVIAETISGAECTNGGKITRTGTASGDEILEARGERVQSLEDLLDATGVDLTSWRVRDYTVNTWEQHSVDRGLVTLYQVKARLERVREALELGVLRDAVVDKMREHSPEPVPRLKTWPTGLAMEVNIPDLHLGKLAHAEETGTNYDGKIAVAAFKHVLADLLNHARTMAVDRIIFPVGNDLLHVDGAENTTTGGTRQDVDSRYHRSVRRAVDLMVWGIELMAQIAPVEVVLLPGNHARTQEAMVGEVLRAWFRRDAERVNVVDSPARRKYLRHGSTLLGFTHGDEVKAKDLPLIMAAEVPDLWAQTTHRAWSTGHLHQRRSTSPGAVEVLEDKGVEVRISPSLSGTDSWHYAKGYVKNLRAAEAYVHAEDAGEVARFRATLPPNFDTREN